MVRLAILLTTYNSSLYLRELMDSVIRQSYGEWTLYIRDDKSSDNTLEIIQEYMKSDPRIVLLNDDTKRGAMNGFFWLLEHVDADYYMFCDHDDVWCPDKVALTLDRMQTVANDNLPVVIHTDLKVVDSNLKVLSESYWRSCHFTDEQFNDKYFHLVYNNVTGCTMMINQKAKQVAMPFPAEARMHDSWIAAAVLWHGGIIEKVDSSTILYRQHCHNTIGANEVPSIFRQILSVRKLFRKTLVQHKVSRNLVKMNVLTFFLMKLYYMIKIHWASLSKFNNR